jgi:hypothetical protein
MMSNNREIKEELQELSPFLLEMKKKEDPFKTPEGYFRRLPGDVLARLHRDKSQAYLPAWLDHLAGNLRTWFWPRYALAFATATVLIVAGIFFMQNRAEEFPSVIADLSEEEIDEYIKANIEEFDLALLVEAIGPGPELEVFPVLDMEEDELEKYLDDILDEIELEEIQEFF